MSSKHVRFSAITGILMIMPLMLVVIGCSSLDSDQTPVDFEIQVYDIKSGSHDQVMSFSDLRGQVVILNFWATWCAPCRVEMPVLDETHTELLKNGSNATVLGIDMGVAEDPPDPATVKFLSQMDISYPVGHPGVRNVGAEFGVVSLPTTLLINENGVVVKKWLGMISRAELIEAVNDLLEP